MIGRIQAARLHPGAQLVPAPPAPRLPWRLLWWPCCGSTEQRLEQDLASGGQPPLALLAGHQRFGHGQRGRPWISPPGGVWLSAALPWPAEPCHQCGAGAGGGGGPGPAARSTRTDRAAQVAERSAGGRAQAGGPAAAPEPAGARDSPGPGGGRSQWSQPGAGRGHQPARGSRAPHHGQRCAVPGGSRAHRSGVGGVPQHQP